MRRGLIIFVCSALLVVSASFAVQRTGASRPTRQRGPDKLVTRIYDVRLIEDELIRRRPVLPHDQPALFGCTAFGSPRGYLTRRDWDEEILNVIMGVIDSDSWTDNGGSIGSVRALDGRLLITHTAVTHDRVALLLASLQTIARPDGSERTR